MKKVFFSFKIAFEFSLLLPSKGRSHKKEMEDEEMDNIEDSDLDAFLPENYTPDQLNKDQA